MWKKIKQMFNRDNFNCSRGYINPFEFHSVIYFLMKCYGVFDESISAWSKLIQVFLICCPLPGLVISVLGIFHGWQISDATVIIESGTYLIILSYNLCILLCIKLNKGNLCELMFTLKEDFNYVCLDGKIYRERFFQNQLLTWKMYMFVVITMSFWAMGMVAAAILALVYYLLTHDPECKGQRPLFFPFWIFEVDFNKSPNYEIALLYSEVCIIAYCYSYIYMIATQILWIREIATKADLVIWRIQDFMDDIYPANNPHEANMFSNIIKHRMRAIVQQHHSMYILMKNYSQVYKKLLMFEQTFCGPVVCLTAYSAAKKIEDGEVNIILIILCLCTVIVSLVPSYLCTFLRIKVTSVSNACWNTPFWNAGPVVRPYLVLIMQRSVRPLPLSLGGFQEVSLQTFANKMTSAYSCFNMLRQAFK